MSSNSAWTGARPHIDESDLLCKTGCGFYGNPAWDGHCSKCYKELVHKRQQRKTVFDPTQIKNKVSRSVSDVTEFQSKASSMMSRKFDKFEEKRRQQLDKKTKAVKSIFRKSQSTKVPHEQSKDHPTRIVRQLSGESQGVVMDFQMFFKQINKDAQQCISKHIKAFMDRIACSLEIASVDELGEQVHDFYNCLSDMVATHPAFSEYPQDQVDKINELAERYITTRLYKAFINTVNAYSEEKDLAIQTRIKSLTWVSTSHLECKVDEANHEVRATMDQIITDLIEINSKRVPMDKLNLLVSASNKVLTLLKQSNGGVPASADDFLPGLIYCVLKANPPLLQSNICYITNFAQQSCLQSGEAGYFFTNLCCAVSFIEKLTADSLGLLQSEFDRYMSGDALPPNALDGTYMCEGMRLMQQNVDNLTDLQAQVNRLIESYENVMVEVEAFKDKSIIAVDEVLERTPLNIRPKKANIDEPDPTQELLPPPLLPQSFQTDDVAGAEKSPQNDSRSVTPLDSGLVTPISGCDSVNDPIFLQKLHQTSIFTSGSTVPSSTQATSNISDTQAPFGSSGENQAMKLHFRSGDHTSYFSPFDVDTLLMSNDPFLMSESSLTSSCDSGVLDSFSSLDYGLHGSSSKGLISLQEETETRSDLSKYSNFETNPKSYSEFHPSYVGIPSLPARLQSRNILTQPLYTGFTVQGGRIPSIACDTGVGHAMLRSSPDPYSPPDPLSPPLSAPQTMLPPPLLPTASSTTDNFGSENKKEDKIDKMVNLLGDIVDTFDSLI